MWFEKTTISSTGGLILQASTHFKIVVFMNCHVEFVWELFVQTSSMIERRRGYLKLFCHLGVLSSENISLIGVGLCERERWVSSWLLEF